MPSTVGWLAVAVVAGALIGLMLGHWSVVTGWFQRCLEDPVSRSPERHRNRRDESIRRTS